jgi:hypothetical protein
MFITRTQQSRARVEALEIWRAAAHVVSTRWDRFLHAEPEMRVFAFASYVAALDSEGRQPRTWRRLHVRQRRRNPPRGRTSS